MDGAFNRRGLKRRPSINITPLIDVMFLLLIFFMVSATFRQDRGIDVSLPTAETAVEQQRSPYDITIAESGDLYFRGRPVDEAALRAAIVEALDADPEALLVLRADEKADFGRAIRVIDLARELGGVRLIIPTRPAPKQESSLRSQ